MLLLLDYMVENIDIVNFLEFDVGIDVENKLEFDVENKLEFDVEIDVEN